MKLQYFLLSAVFLFSCDDDKSSNAVCGNQLAETTEECDGGDLKNTSCESMGYYGGQLTCVDCELDFSSCEQAGYCGDGLIQANEQCDTDAINADCSTFGLGTGNLECTSDCRYDTSSCEVQAECGDNIVNGTEDCDGTNLDGFTCFSLGFASGTLECTQNCEFDTSSCLIGEECSDNIKNGTEECDGGDLGSSTCESLGYYGGNLSCTAGCTYETSACSGRCGDGMVQSSFEDCDGTELNGSSCITLGYTGGSLACSSTCTFDISSCEMTEEELVCTRWNSDRSNLSEGTWTGNVSTCSEGDITNNGRENALKIVNLYRWLADLPSVTTDATLNAKAQKCALMMDANNTLNHSPPASWTCYTSDGANAAGSSNLASTPGVDAVDLYMTDPGNPTTMGHRRWILSNSFGPTGLGSTDSYSCMWAFGSGNAGKTWTAWPSPGVFPYGAVAPSWSSFDSTGWTLQSDSINLGSATVTITMDGSTARPVTVTSLASGYGSSYAISMIPQGWTTQAGHTYTVSVTGISQTITYDVHVVDCSGY